MTEPTNAVLNEKIIAISTDLREFKKTTDRKIDVANEKISTTKDLADEVSFTLIHMKESMDNMNRNMTEFIKIVGEQSKKIDKSDESQKKKFDDFVDTDRKLNSNREFFISIIQVASGIIIAIIGFWTYNQF